MVVKKDKSVLDLKIIDKEGKEKVVKDVMVVIIKGFGFGFIMKLGEKSFMNVEFILIGSINLDIVLGIGGVFKGRIIEIYGVESLGKIIFVLYVIVEV